MIQGIIATAKKVYALSEEELDQRIKDIRFEMATLEEFNISNFDLNIEAMIIVHRMIELGKEIKP